MADVEVEAVLADPEGVLERLRTQEGGLERALAVVRRRIEVAACLAEAAAQWRELAGGGDAAGGDAPGAGGREVGLVVVATGAEHGQVTGGEERGEDTGGGGDAGGRLPRRVLVADLLGQDPARVWRVAEVGQALGVDNLKSLGVLMSQMAGKGVLVKTGSGCYRAPGAGDGSGVAAV
jgi:hypothetical protein